MNSTKKLFPAGPDGLDSLIPQTTDLFMSGLHWLKVVSSKESEIRFFQWARLIREARANAKEMDLTQLEWLWDAITSEPKIRRFFDTRIISLDDEWKEIEPVKCVPAQSRFGIFLKNLSAYGTPVLSLPPEIKPAAEAVILDPLFMQPGKARRLECCDVDTTLEIRPSNLGPRNVEAAGLKVGLEEVTIKEGCIYVSVKSLNHAYTKASLRLEPHRRGPGGRAYDHMALMQDNGEWKTLEGIRLENEEKLWKRLLGDD